MKHERWLGWWRDRAEAYFTDKVWKFSRPDLIDRLGIDKETYILEVGYGYGRETEQFCMLSDHVYGLELSSHAQRATYDALTNHGQVEILPALFTYDGQRVPFHAGKFNIVYSCFVLQHMSRMHVSDFLRECERVLRPGGLMLHEFFGDPEFYPKAGAVDAFSGDPKDGGMYNNAWTREEIIKEFGQITGLGVEWITEWPIQKDWGNKWVCARKVCDPK